MRPSSWAGEFGDPSRLEAVEHDGGPNNADRDASTKIGELDNQMLVAKTVGIDARKEQMYGGGKGMSMRSLRRYLAAPVFVLVLLVVSALPAVAAPTLNITSPADASTVSGSSVTVNWESTDVTIKPPAEAQAMEEGHYHAFLDVEPVTASGQPIPTGPGIVHTANTEATFDNVAPGEHTVTVVLGYRDHSAWQPVVSDTVTFTLADGLGQIAPATGVMKPTHKGPILLAVIGGLVVILGGVILRRRDPGR